MLRRSSIPLPSPSLALVASAPRRPSHRPWAVRGLEILVLVVTIAVVTAGLIFPAHASSHSEAPGTARDRLADDTDLYAFVSRDARQAVTFVGLWVPLLEPNGGPNFYSFDEQASYYINIDNEGDCVDHIRYRFTFQTTRQNGNTFLYNTGVVTSLDDPDLNVRQTYSITRITNGVETVLASGLPVAPNFVGPVSMPNYRDLARAAVQELPDGSRVFCGPRDDPFFVDLGSLFDLLTIRRPPGNRGRGIDGVAGFDAMAIALQVPFERLTSDGQAPTPATSVLGIYNSTERPSTRIINSDGTVSVSGPEVQVSRLGMPLVNEVVIALQDKDRFNATKPTGDGAFLNYVTNPELAGLLSALYGIKVPPTPRNDLVTVFLKGIPDLNENGGTCEMLRLNMLVPPVRRPSRFGVLARDNAGFPNGRRLADDVVDIELRVAAGVLVPGFGGSPNNRLGDGVDANDRPFLPYFPYLALPHDPLDHSHDGDDQDANKVTIEGEEASNNAGRDAEEAQIDEAQVGATTRQPTSPGLAVAARPGASSRLEFAVPQTAHVKLEMYDARGRRVRTLVDQDAAAGTFTAQWDGRDAAGARLAGGVYLARFALDGRVIESRKVTLVR